MKAVNATTKGAGLPLAEPYANLLRPGYPAPANAAFVVERPLTPENVAASHNNFYEFTQRKSEVWRRVGAFKPRPWTVTIDGLVERPLTIDLESIEKMGLEERVYRFRCVEAWAMAVPWTGIPFATLLQRAKPLSSARYVRLESFSREDQAENQRRESSWPWPYFESFRLDELAHPLALLATGIFGHALPRQHGAPIRLVLPWKYGFKNIKSIARISFTKERPSSFWRELAPKEYGFFGNVNPKVAHPRWSQTKERMIGSGSFHQTQWLNDYAEEVASLYGPQPIREGWDRAISPFFG